MATLAQSAFGGVNVAVDATDDAVALELVGITAVAQNDSDAESEGRPLDSDEDEETGGAGTAEQCTAAGEEQEKDEKEVLRGKRRRQQIMSIKTTNAADDYAHRGIWLTDFHFLGYQMYVKRVTLHDADGHVWPFESHYPLASRYGQQIRMTMAVPRFCNFKCPSMAENAEENAMMKSILLTPITCPGKDFCHHVCRFNPILGFAAMPAADLPKCRRPTFQSGWRTRWRRVELEAAASDQKEEIAGKISVLRDTTLFKAWLPPGNDKGLTQRSQYDHAWKM